MALFEADLAPFVWGGGRVPRIELLWFEPKRFDRLTNQTLLQPLGHFTVLEVPSGNTSWQNPSRGANGLTKPPGKLCFSVSASKKRSFA